MIKSILSIPNLTVPWCSLPEPGLVEETGDGESNLDVLDKKTPKLLKTRTLILFHTFCYHFLLLPQLFICNLAVACNLFSSLAV